MDAFAADFRDAMESSGVGAPVGAFICDGNIHRYVGNGDKPGRANCWYVLHRTPSGGFGAFGNWRTEEKHGWSSFEYREFQSMEKRAFSLRQREPSEVDAKRVRSHLDAKHEVDAELMRSNPATPDHPYLKAKGITNCEGLGIHQRGDLLLIPLTDVSGVVWSVQRIQSNGEKRFAKGGRVSGCFASIDLDFCNVEELIVCEGYATAVSLFEEYRLPVVAALSAGNLKAVVMAFHERWPAADIFVAGDDDRFTKGNPGQRAANEAAAAVGAQLIFPPFKKYGFDTGTDFNDFFLMLKKVL